jgi:peroxisomal membrane protein 4
VLSFLDFRRNATRLRFPCIASDASRPRGSQYLIYFHSYSFGRSAGIMAEAPAVERPINILLEEIREVLLSAFGGARYGAKIRLPHALVMSLLFGGFFSTTSTNKNNDIKSILRRVVQLTVEHASNLAKFAAIYKTVLFALKLICTSSSSSSNPQRNVIVVVGQPQYSWHAAIAGAIGGYYSWGHYSAVNQQLLLYLASRVLLGAWKKLTVRRIPFPAVAALIWGAVMYLFEDDAQVLHPSLKSSMDEIYRYSSMFVGDVPR